jgi:LCP family protein required for cell wall assembly
MQRTARESGPRRSAFAAAFFSFLLPGLGHAYLGRWLRAVAWAIPPVLVMAAVGGIAVSPGRSELIGLLSDPAMLMAVLGFLVLDLLYRLVALLDAYRLARAPVDPSGISRMASAAGLLAVVLVLVASHVALARPVLIVYDVLASVTDGDDDSALPDLRVLENDPNFRGIVIPGLNDPSTQPGDPAAGADDPSAAASDPDPGAGQAASRGGAGGGGPTMGPTNEPDDTGTIPPKYEWDGRKRLDILLIGADGGRQGYGGYLTDTMLVVSVDPPTGRVAFISLPRDTVGVPLPRSWRASRAYGGAYPYKINTLYTAARAAPSLFPGDDRERGFEALKGALSQLLGLDIRYHVAVDLSGFRDVVNALGGEVIDVQMPVQDEAYPADDGRGKLKLYIPPGIQYMPGGEALSYARSRHESSDFDRAARQQRVITSVRDQTDLSALFESRVLDRMLRTVKKDVKTDIPPRMLPKLVALAQKVDLDRRISLVLSAPTYGSVCYPCPPNGQWAIKANVPRMRAAAQNVFKGDPRAEARRLEIASEGAVIHVLNGTRSSNTRSTRIAEALMARGFDAMVPPVNGGRAPTSDAKQTVITVYNRRQDDFPETIRSLQKIFRVKAVSVDDPSARADIVITVGTRTDQL